MIESIWKDKVRSENIKETIQSAFNEIYRGNFEEIKELDEEQMYNSWINSKSNTERIKNDSKGVSLKKRITEHKDERTITVFSDEQEDEPQLEVIGLYEKKLIENEIKDNAATNLNIDIRDKPSKHHNGMKRRTKVNRSDSENLAGIKHCNVKEPIEIFQQMKDSKFTGNFRVHEPIDLSDDNTSSENEGMKVQAHLPTSYFKEYTKKHMRSFDKNSNQNMRINNRTINGTIDDLKNTSIKHTTTLRDYKRPHICLKEQYYTNIQNKIRRDKHNTSKTDVIDQKLKHSIKYTTKEYNLRLSLNKMHVRNRSANSIRCKSYLEDNGSNKNDMNVVTDKRHDQEKMCNFSLKKTELYR